MDGTDNIEWVFKVRFGRIFYSIKIESLESSLPSLLSPFYHFFLVGLRGVICPLSILSFLLQLRLLPVLCDNYWNKVHQAHWPLVYPVELKQWQQVSLSSLNAGEWNELGNLMGRNEKEQVRWKVQRKR